MKNVTKKQVKEMTFTEKSRLSHKLAKAMEGNYQARLKLAWEYITGKRKASIKAINNLLNGEKKQEKKAEKQDEPQMTPEEIGNMAGLFAQDFFNELETSNIIEIVTKETKRRQCDIHIQTPELFLQDLQTSEDKQAFATHILAYSGRYAFWTASKYHDIGVNHDAEMAILESQKQENSSQWEKLTGLGLEKHAITDTAQKTISDMIRLVDVSELFDHDSPAKFYGTIKRRTQNAIRTELNRKKQLAKNGNTFTSLDNEKSQSILEKMAQGVNDKQTDYMMEVIAIMQEASITEETAKIALMKMDGMGVKQIAENLGVKDCKRHVEKARKELVEKLGWGKELLEGKRRKQA